ncbi:transposase [Streptomyces globisporus]|uniref:transposase n=1 Tax=Streptomyces globisporus TaxID=1908 RepID=UPI00099DBDC2|nr:transposase [Streptomyces globisporus]
MIPQHRRQRGPLAHGGPHEELVRTDHTSPPLPFKCPGSHQHRRPPKLALPKPINSLKGVSSRYLRAEYTGQINRMGMSSVFWSRSYFAGSCGGASLSIVHQCIEGQKRPI